MLQWGVSMRYKKNNRGSYILPGKDGEEFKVTQKEYEEIKKIYDILYCNTVKLKDRSQEIKQLLKKKILTTNQLEDREISYDSFFIDKHI